MSTSQPSLFDHTDLGDTPLPSTRKGERAAGGGRQSPAQPALFVLEEDEGAADLPEGYRVVGTPEALEALAGRLSAAPYFAVDTETTALDPLVADLVGLSVSPAVGEAYYVPVGHAAGRQLAWPQVAAALRPLLEDPARPKVGHNLKFDIRVLERAGIAVRGPAWDTMIAAHLVREEGSHGLKECARAYLGRQMQTYEAVVGRRDIREVGIRALARYACEDAEATLALYQALAPKLADLGLEKVFALECALVPVVARMESDGIALDVPYLEGVARDLEAQVGGKAEACYAAAGCRFNLNSPRQIAEVLYARLGLPASRTTATGASTDEAALKELAGSHPLPGCILEYRELNKLLTTYAQALPRAVSPVTGRIHPSFHQIGARSGRFSCANPNLQNLPKDAANTIRRAFVAAPGHVLLSADYSQIELRVLAQVSRDPALLAAFAAGEDIHARTAADVFGVALDAVTPEQRRVAKSINFGLVYGMSARGLAAQLEIPVPEAECYVEAYFARYAGVRRCMAEVLRRARAEGAVVTLYGRRRRVAGLSAPDGRVRGQAERQAINAPIQGTAADILKAAMVRLAPRLPEFGARMLLQVHDELVLEVPEERAEDLRRVVVSVMEAPPLPDFTVPLRVDTKVGRVWE